MDWLNDNTQWVLLACGALTATMLTAALSPVETMRALFGDLSQSPAANMVVRNWGVLIALGGLFLIYAAFNPEHRAPAIVLVGASKIAFVVFALTGGRRLLRRQGVIAVVADIVMLAVLAACLFSLPA